LKEGEQHAIEKPSKHPYEYFQPIFKVKKALFRTEILLQEYKIGAAE
jgi:hypothetical protein